MLIRTDLDKISLKYPDKVPKDYDISKLQYTFDFVYLVLKRDANIDSAVRGVANEYDLSKTYLMDYLVENKYVLDKTSKNEFSQKIKQYNTKSLKKILKKHGLKTSGKRERIEKRIFKHNLLGNNYYLSSKSKTFYKNKKRRIRIYNDYLFDYYYFNEFNEFYMDNYRKKEVKIPIEFIKQYIHKAFEDEDYDKYILNNQIMVDHFLKKEKWHKMLEYVLKNFCMSLNPIWKIDDLKNHEGLLIDTYRNLIFLNEKLSKNTIISNYYLVWDSYNFERIIVPKFEGYRYLKDILNLKDYDKLNNNLSTKFYSNEDLKIKRITQKTLFDF